MARSQNSIRITVSLPDGRHREWGNQSSAFAASAEPIAWSRTPSGRRGQPIRSLATLEELTAVGSDILRRHEIALARPWTKAPGWVRQWSREDGR